MSYRYLKFILILNLINYPFPCGYFMENIEGEQIRIWLEVFHVHGNLASLGQRIDRNDIL